MSRPILVTGATGNQGGAVVDALLRYQHEKKLPFEITILALTRNPNSASAGRLAAKSPNTIKLVKGDLNDVPEIFRNAQKATTEPIWGVFAVLMAKGSGGTIEGELSQGFALIDESVKQNVKHFVYTSVDRGGDERSWDNPTEVPHFVTKHKIEHHLRDVTAKQNDNKMAWTILRPVALMDYLQPGFQLRIFMTVLRDKLEGKSLQWVSTKDVGYFTALAFSKPDEWSGKAIALAGDDLTFDQMSSAFERETGKPLSPTFSIVGTALLFAVHEIDSMVTWFKNEGYGADIAKLRKLNPELQDLAQWLKQDSKFEKV